MRSLIETRTGDGVFVVAPDYTIVYWDRQAEHLIGCLAEDVIGDPCYDALLGEREGGDPFCGLGCSVMPLAQIGRPVADYDMRVATSAGEKRWVNVSLLSVDSEEGVHSPLAARLPEDARDAGAGARPHTAHQQGPSREGAGGRRS